MLDFNQTPTSHRELLSIGKVVLVHKHYEADQGREDVLRHPQPLVTPAKLQIKHLPAPAVFQGQTRSPAGGRAFASTRTQAKLRGSVQLQGSFYIYLFSLPKFACLFRQGTN